MNYLYRTLFDEVKKWIDRKEIIAIKGPRQSGKTTLLKMLSAWLETDKGIAKENIIYLSFEDRELLDDFTLNPMEFIGSRIIGKDRHYFLIDEAQYCGDLGQKLKLVYDTYESTKFIITGSSSLELTAQTGKFLVGRLFEFELMPLSFYEFLLAKDRRLATQFQKENKKIIRLIEGAPAFKPKSRDIFVKELLRYFDEFIAFGGYPEVVKAKNHKEKIEVLRGIVNTYIQKDVISYLHITDTIKFRKLVVLLAASDGCILNIDNIAVQISSYFKDTSKLLDILEQTYVIKLLRPYHKNLVTEIRKNPKVYFVDTGLRNYLIDNTASIEKRSDAGALAENFVLNEVGRHVKMNFWRTTAKTEVDFVASKREAVPVEVKFSHFDKSTVTKSVYGFTEAYKSKRGIMVTKDFWGEKRFHAAKISFVPICYF